MIRDKNEPIPIQGEVSKVEPFQGIPARPRVATQQMAPEISQPAPQWAQNTGNDRLEDFDDLEDW